MIHLTRAARWIGVLCAGAAYAYLMFAPMYGTTTTTVEGVTERGSATLIDVNGMQVVVVLAVPVLAALLPFLPVTGTARRVVAILAATIATGFVLLRWMSVGQFFIPSALAILVAALGTMRQSQPGLTNAT